MLLFVIILTFLCPVLMIPLNGYLFIRQPKYKVIYIFLVCLGLGAIAYNFTPLAGQNTDIVRHFHAMEVVKGMSFSQIFGNETYTELIVYYLYLKVVSLLGDAQLLPAISTVIGYFICFYLIYRISEKEKKNWRILAYILFVSAVSFLGFCSGVRQYLTFSIFAWMLYFETTNKKLRLLSWIVYLLLVPFHGSMILIIFLRLVGEIISKGKNYRFAFIVLFWSLAQNTLAGYLAQTLGGNVYVDYFLSLIDYYGENASAFILPAYLYRLALSICCCVIAYTILRNLTNEDRYLKKYTAVALIVCFFAIGGATSYDILSRFSSFTFILVIPLLPKYLSIIKLNYKKIVYSGLMIFSVLVFVYNIGQYNTIHFNDFATMITTNIFTVLGGLI